MRQERISRRTVWWLRVVGICDPETSVAVDGEVDGLIVMRAVEQLLSRPSRAVLEKVNHAASAFLRTEHRPVLRDRKSVRAPGEPPKELCLLGRRIVAQDLL